MGCVRNCFLLTAILIGCLGYFLYVPVPDYVDSPGKFKILSAYMKIGHVVSVISEAVGCNSYINTTRAMFNLAMKEQDLTSDANTEVLDTNFDGVRVIVYKPKGNQNDLPGIVYMHGGAYVLMRPDAYDSVTRAMSRQLNMVVVSIDYRLAPEHTLPLQIDECVTATVYFMKNAAKFGVDANRIALVGDSAGGHLVAAVTLKLTREASLPSPKAQVLIYPVLQMCDKNLPSQHYVRDVIGYDVPLNDGSICSYMLGLDVKYASIFKANRHVTPSVRKLCSALVDVSLIPENLISKGYRASSDEDSSDALSQAVMDQLTDPYLFPLMNDDMRGLPTTFILTVEFDSIRDEGIIYAKRLQKAGVNVDWFHCRHCWHGCINSFDQGSKSGSEAFANVLNFVRKTL